MLCRAGGQQDMILNLEGPADVLSPNGPFPFKNGLFLVYSTIAEIRCKFDHFGPQKGRWARNGAFPLKNGEACDSCQCSHMSNTPMHDVHMLKVLVWTQ